jgi:transposase
MSQGARIIGPDRAQLRWDMVDLDSQLPEEHRARTVWAFVEKLDLREFYERIKARDDVAGRPATDPRVVLAVWLYATIEGIGSARAIDRLCQQHTAYRWLCGGAPINHDILSTFRRENGELLDQLLTQSVTGLIAAKVITLEEVAIDGTKVRARAGRGSLSQQKRLERIETAVAERVAKLKAELEEDPAGQQRAHRKRALQAAEERGRRIARAHQKLEELQQEKQKRATTHAKEEAEKGEVKVSTSDPEARLMRLPDGATAPAYNVQVATCSGFIVATQPTDRPAQRHRVGAGPGGTDCAMLRARPAAVAGRRKGDDTGRHRHAGPGPSGDAGVQPAARRARGREARNGTQAALGTQPRTGGGAGLASPDDQCRRAANLPPAQIDRTGARHHQEPRHVALPGAWPEGGACGLRVAGFGPQPLLGRHGAAADCVQRAGGRVNQASQGQRRPANAPQPDPKPGSARFAALSPNTLQLKKGTQTHPAPKKGDWVTSSKAGTHRGAGFEPMRRASRRGCMGPGLRRDDT